MQIYHYSNSDTVIFLFCCAPYLHLFQQTHLQAGSDSAYTDVTMLAKTAKIYRMSALKQRYTCMRITMFPNSRMSPPRGWASIIRYTDCAPAHTRSSSRPYVPDTQVSPPEAQAASHAQNGSDLMYCCLENQIFQPTSGIKYHR